MHTFIKKRHFYAQVREKTLPKMHIFTLFFNHYSFFIQNIKNHTLPFLLVHFFQFHKFQASLGPFITPTNGKNLRYQTLQKIAPLKASFTQIYGKFHIKLMNTSSKVAHYMKNDFLIFLAPNFHFIISMALYFAYWNFLMT